MNAQDLEELLERQETLEQALTSLNESVSTLSRGQVAAAEAIEHLEHGLTGGAPADPADPADPAAPSKDAPEPHWWAQTADQDAWVELADWVDAFITRYELGQYLRPCWPAHPGVVEELAAMRSAWRQAALKTNAGDDDALTFWHDRVMVPTVQRLASNFYPIKLCRDGHQRVDAPKVTNRTLISLEDHSPTNSEVSDDH